jgi:hypothetical protein
LGNILIYVPKWTIWKQRNKIKYQNVICKTPNAELTENLILRQKYYTNTSPNIDIEINYRSRCEVFNAPQKPNALRRSHICVCPTHMPYKGH